MYINCYYVTGGGAYWTGQGQTALYPFYNYCHITGGGADWTRLAIVRPLYNGQTNLLPYHFLMLKDKKHLHCTTTSQICRHRMHFTTRKCIKMHGIRKGEIMG